MSRQLKRVGCTFVVLAPILILAVIISANVPRLVIAIIFMLFVFAIVLDTDDY